jgi:proline racemase
MQAFTPPAYAIAKEASFRYAMAYVDSHTEGEPTRVVHSGLPALSTTPRESIEQLVRDHPRLRATIVDEPRGHAALVAALLLPSSSADHQVVFLNNVGMLPMCVHASLGIARSLVHLGLRPPCAWSRPLWLDTPAGRVGALIDERGTIAVENVPAYRSVARLPITTSLGPLVVDVAWGGNWFAIVDESPIELHAARVDDLVGLCRAIRAAPQLAELAQQLGAPIDHVQLCGPPRSAETDACNFVLCPGDAYDRSPCGTGTSARMACLHADDRLPLARRWRQGSFTGTRFVGHLAARGSELIPTIEGRVFITGEGRLLVEHDDDLLA